ncbi:hypothetical protein ACFL1N_06320 [Thermodesulfobacteriota bacterium]
MRVDKRLIIWSIIGTGISSIAVQLLTIREFITQFHGNEITISLVLFVWLFLNGVGSLGAKIIKISKVTTYIFFILIIALWPLPQLIIIRYFRDALLLHGASPGFYQIFFYIALTTAPYCLLIGFILPSALNLLKHDYHDFSSGELYITDNIGDIAGGAVFSFFLVYWMNPFKTIAVTSGLLLLISLLLLIKAKKNIYVVLSVMAIIIFFIYYAMDSQVEKDTLNKQYGNISIYNESPFGRIVITKEEDQHTFWESGIPLYSDSDITGNEEKIHYALCQLDGKIGDILLISGGLGETLSEINKYKPDNIDYVELDPSITGLALEAGLLEKIPNLRIINSDGRAYLKETEKKYDAIIMDLPEPDTFQLNRFFTSEFFSISKERLNKNGILSFGMKYYGNYISDITRTKLSSIYNSVNQYFSNVIIIPGGDAYYLCSNSDLYTDIPERLQKKSINTEYINWFYYGNVTEDRINQVMDSIDRDEYINTDFEPRMMNIVFKEWFAKYGSSPRTFFIVVMIIVFLYVIFMRQEEYVLFSSGLAAMGVEILVIYCFQIMYGYVYLKIGVIVTVFLLGLLPGAVVGSMYIQKRDVVLLFSEFVIILLLICYYIWISFFKTDIHQIWFMVYCFLISFFCGFQFPIVAGIIGEKTSPAAGCLAADLAGAAVGTLLVGTLLVPFAGIQSAVIFIISIKLISSFIVMLRRKGRN